MRRAAPQHIAGFCLDVCARMAGLGEMPRDAAIVCEYAQIVAGQTRSRSSLRHYLVPFLGFQRHLVPPHSSIATAEAFTAWCEAHPLDPADDGNRAWALETAILDRLGEDWETGVERFGRWVAEEAARHEHASPADIEQLRTVQRRCRLPGRGARDHPGQAAALADAVLILAACRYPRVRGNSDVSLMTPGEPIHDEWLALSARVLAGEPWADPKPT